MPFLNFNHSLDVNKQAELTRCACAISHQPRTPSATPSALARRSVRDRSFGSPFHN